MQRRRRTDDVLLLRQWFAELLKPYDYMSVLSRDHQGEQTIEVFQLLGLERKNIIVRPFIAAEEAAELQGLYVVPLQKLEVWGGGGRSSLRPDMLSHIDTFVFEGPTKMDIIATIGGGLDKRRGIFVWKARTSDVEGCVELFDRELLADRVVDPMSPRAPVLSLLDALSQQAYVGVDALVVHGPGVRQYDRRRLPSRRAYLQCVLRMDDLIARGVSQFSSVGSASFFEALLRSKKAVRPGLPAADYKRLLAIERGDDDALADLDARPKPPLPAPPAARRRPAPPIVDGGDSSDSSIVGCGGSGGGRKGDGAQRVERSLVGSDGEGSVVGVAGPAGAAAVVAVPEPLVAGQAGRALPPGVPAMICGVKVQFVAGRITATHTYVDRLSVRCSNDGHERCSKSRSLELLKERLGERCAEAFLGAWLAKAGSMTEAEHRKYMPRLAEMQAYLETVQ